METGSYEVADTRRRAPGEAAGTRHENDDYPTHPDCALAIVKWLSEAQLPGVSPKNPAVILEPTAGSGPFVAAVRAVYPDATIVASDLMDRREACLAVGASAAFQGDALQIRSAAIAVCDLIISNPPFKLADALVRHFYAHMKDGAVLALLLPVTFLGSQERWQAGEGLYALAPLAGLSPIVPRPEFGEASSPKFEAGVFIWVKGSGFVGRILSPVRWEKPKKARTPRKARRAAPTVEVSTVSATDLQPPSTQTA